MQQTKKTFYKNILGDTKETIEAIQRFLDKNPPLKKEVKNTIEEENPAESVNRVIKSVLNEEISNEIQKIIKEL